MGRRFLWKPEAGVEITDAPYDFLATDTFQKSPLPAVIRTGRAIRRRLADPDCPRDFVILAELAAGGVTDYLIDPLDFSDGQVHAVAWTTTRADGFADDDLAALAAIRAPLARLVEIYALRRVMATLLSTYAARGAGQRILQGRIRRGDIERIRAVLLVSDLRGFTTLSDRLPGEQVIALLNGYFDGLVPAIEGHGGEVLKFIGDGLLAIFPVAADPAAACAAALAAAEAARAALAEGNAVRLEAGEAELRNGMALHLGEVLYGNVGSAARLDFTTIGPGGQPDRPARDARPRPRPGPGAVGGVRGGELEPRHLARPLRAARLRRAPGGVRARGRLRRAASLAEQVQRDPALAAAGAVLEQENALPAAEIGLALDHRDRQMGLGQGRPDVRRHVVGAFLGVGVVADVLRHQFAEERVDVVEDARVGVLLDQERGRGMMEVDGQQPARDALGRNPGPHPLGDLVEPLTVGREEQLLEPLAHGLLPWPSHLPGEQALLSWIAAARPQGGERRAAGARRGFGGRAGIWRGAAGMTDAKGQRRATHG